MTTATEAPSHDEKGHIDPAAAVVTAATVPVQTRSERFRSFDPEAFERPTGREVNWKHTPVARLARLFDAADPQTDGVTVTVSPTTDAAASARGDVFRPEDLPSAIAWAQSPEAVSVVVDGEHEVPIRVDLVGAGGRATAHVVIEARPHSRATVLLDHTGTAEFAENVEIVVRDGADLTVVALHRWADDAVHAASHQARVDRDAHLRHIVVSFGGGLVRVNPSVELAGAGAVGELYGLAFADAGQHLESQVYLHHKGGHTSGDVLYKAALQGDTARTVWVGDVLIGPDAVGTDSYEANRNLVLTSGARADSIPNLEIETGDIVGAGHASATGRFDEEQLFYLQARGIPEAEARRLVVIGFLAEIVQKIGVPDLEEQLTAAIEAELAGEDAR